MLLEHVSVLDGGRDEAKPCSLLFCPVCVLCCLKTVCTCCEYILHVWLAGAGLMQVLTYASKLGPLLVAGNHPHTHYRYIQHGCAQSDTHL
jgi:hypothetical protein